MRLPDAFLDPPTTSPPPLPLPCPSSVPMGASSAASASAKPSTAACDPSLARTQQPAESPSCKAAPPDAGSASSPEGTKLHRSAGSCSEGTMSSADPAAATKGSGRGRDARPLMAPPAAQAHHAHAPRWHFDMVQVSCKQGFAPKPKPGSSGLCCSAALHSIKLQHMLARSVALPS